MKDYLIRLYQSLRALFTGPQSVWHWPILGRALRCTVCVLALLLVAFVLILGTLIYAPERGERLVRALGKVTETYAQTLPAATPEQKPVTKAFWLDQNWSNKDRFWFHHTSQGTATIPVPYDWFMSLEQPRLHWSIFFGSVGKLSDPDYLAKFGFIPSPDVEALKEAKGREAFGYGQVPAEVSADGYNRRDDREQESGFPDNPDNLPVGFARLKASTGSDAPNRASPEGLGFTCAACHTGHLEYNGVSLRIDGGAAMVDFSKLQGAIGQAIVYTIALPRWLGQGSRFNRFADRVLEREDRRNPNGNGKSRKERKKELEAKLRTLVATIRTSVDLQSAIRKGREKRDVHEGYGRLDALNRIANQVFYNNLLPQPLLGCVVQRRLKGIEEQPRQAIEQCENATAQSSGSVPHNPRRYAQIATNFQRVNAPVSLPPLWGVPWFSWAQYDASVLNELVRNAGEALGVSARADMSARPETQFASSIELLNIYWMEELLRGEHPLEGQRTNQFKGLRSPTWPTLKLPADRDTSDGETNNQPNGHWSWEHLGDAWKVDWDKVTRGRVLYKEHCFECHRGPVNDRKFDIEFGAGMSFWSKTNSDGRANWVPIGGKDYFNVVQMGVDEIGTDPQQALVLSTRPIYLPRDLIVNPTQLPGATSAPNDPIAALNAQHNCGIPNDPAARSNFALALMAVVDRTIDRWFADNQDRLGSNPAEIAAKKADMLGSRPNCPNRQAFQPVVVKKRPDTDSESSAADESLVPVYERKKIYSGRKATDRSGDADGTEKIAVRPVYRARPLDGIWATAPYLHNGAVPTLEQLLLPASERTKVFCIGNRQFDPEKVGLDLSKKAGWNAEEQTCDRGLTRIDTRDLGNSNAGHSFEAPPGQNKRTYPAGTIGPVLSAGEREDLIEYLKTL